MNERKSLDPIQRAIAENQRQKAIFEYQKARAAIFQAEIELYLQRLPCGEE